MEAIQAARAEVERRGQVSLQMHYNGTPVMYYQKVEDDMVVDMFRPADPTAYNSSEAGPSGAGPSNSQVNADMTENQNNTEEEESLKRKLNDKHLNTNPKKRKDY